ncbi:MAG: sigma-70 family RNA polymerase sigma factor [Pirellulaceae bacterium]
MPKKVPQSAPTDAEVQLLLPKLKKFAHKRFSRLDPDDVVHSGIVKFLRSPHPYDDPQQLFRLLCRATVWSGLEAVKKDKRQHDSHQEYDTELLVDESSDWDVYHWELESDLDDVLATLSPIERDVAERRRDGITFIEIAEMLNRSERGIRLIHDRVKSKLAELLA